MATRDITTKIAIEGEKEYQSGVKTINSELKTLRSEMKLVESQFSEQMNTAAALSAKGETLNKMYSAQEEKLKLLKQALSGAKEAQKGYAELVAEGEKRVQARKNALAELGEETGDTSQKQEELKAALAKANAELAQAKLNQEENTRKCNSYQTQINATETALNDLNSELDKNNSYLDEAKKSSDGCAESIDKYGKETKQASEKRKSFQTN